MEQLSLFENTHINKEIFANNILNDLNRLDTIWKGTFYIDHIELSKWEHISDPDKVLEIVYMSTMIEELGKGNCFTQWCDYKDDELKLLNLYEHSDTLMRYADDKDLSVSVTPDMIFVFFHKFERKR